MTNLIFLIKGMLAGTGAPHMWKHTITDIEEKEVYLLPSEIVLSAVET